MKTDTEHWLTYRWQKGNRYYVAEVGQDLFGAWLLKRTWGSIHTHRGHSKTVCADNYEHALKLLQVVVKRRRARGYSQTANLASRNRLDVALGLVAYTISSSARCILIAACRTLL